jgi:hypothetical protein
MGLLQSISTITTRIYCLTLIGCAIAGILLACAVKFG